MTTNADTAGALMDASSRIAALVPRHADLPVPTCPGWTVGRLAIHVGRIHRWVAVALDTPDDRPVPAVARPAAGTDVAAWLIDGANHLLEAFARVGPNGAVRAPGWAQPASWWQRRTTHETVLHAWDAAAATGTAPPIPRWLATDAIDETLTVFAAQRLDLERFGPAATIHLHCTDTPSDATPGTVDAGEWLIHIGPDGTVTERIHAKGDVAARASASDLLLWAWGRVGTDRLETFGDTAVLDRYQAAAHY